MLPAKYFPKRGGGGGDTTGTGDHDHHGLAMRGGIDGSRPPPPLGITGVLCQNGTVRIAGRGTLSYTVYRPRMMMMNTTTTTTAGGSSRNNTTSGRIPTTIPSPPPPLVCVAGGPGMTSNYLSVLVHGIVDRAIVLYDHMGCGQSVFSMSVPPQYPQKHTTDDDDDDADTDDNYDDETNHDDTSHTVQSNPQMKQKPKQIQQQQQARPMLLLEDAITDLHALLLHLFPEGAASQKFHLLGHSFGGLVAFECVKRYYNSPCDGGNDLEEQGTGGNHQCQSLILANVPYNVSQTMARRQQLRNEFHDTNNNDDETAAVRFLQTYECRCVPMPLPLQQSLESLLRNNNNNNNTTYGCRPKHNVDEYYMNYTIHGTITNTIRIALLFGEHDFVSDDIVATAAWKESCPNAQIFRLKGCSHYSMVENDTLFNKTVAAFLNGE